MKKQKIETKKLIQSKPKFSPILLAAFIVAFVATGAYFISNMFAASPCYNYAYGATRLICFANEQVTNANAKETKENRGVNIDVWNTKNMPSGSGCGLGDAWCASFVTYQIYMGYGSWSLRDCSTASLVDKYRANHQVLTFNKANLKVGDIVYRTRGDEGGGHVGIVKQLWASEFRTIEGNVNCGGGLDCVAYRNYWYTGAPSDGKSPGADNWIYILRW